MSVEDVRQMHFMPKWRDDLVASCKSLANQQDTTWQFVIMGWQSCGQPVWPGAACNRLSLVFGLF
jgi:hypothetical protein